MTSEINNHEQLSKIRHFDFQDYANKLESQFADQKEALEKVFELASSFKENGGRALLVGGSVRDLFLHKIPKDYDIEIYGLDSDTISKVANSFGKVSDVGKAFGVLKLNVDNIDIDISLPRTDSKTGDGHKGFDVETNPNMSIEDAAKRRDFTFNSLAADPLTGEIFDYFGGVSDLENKILRVTDPERFKDDPLRVMRGLQFISRFGLEIDPDTKKILTEMVPKLKELPKERMVEEWKKLLVKGNKPSLALMTGMEIGLFHDLYPSFPPLTITEQEPDWHPEGNVWEHTLLVVDEAKKISRINNLNDNDTFILMLSSMCHDIGKPETTEIIDNKITSRGHDKAGLKPSKEFLDALGVDNETYYKVIPLVTDHMSPSLLYHADLKGEKVSDGAIRKLAQRIYPATINELVLVAMSDHLGRGSYNEDDSFEPLATNYPAGEWLLKRANELALTNNKPEKMISGKDLMDIGYKKPKGEEGKKFGKIINLGDKLRDLSELSKIKGIDEEQIDKIKYLEMINKKNFDEAIITAKKKGIEIVQKIRKSRSQKNNSETK